MTKMKMGSMTRTWCVKRVTSPVAKPHTMPITVPPNATTKKDAKPASRSVARMLLGPISVYDSNMWYRTWRTRPQVASLGSSPRPPAQPSSGSGGSGSSRSMGTVGPSPGPRYPDAHMGADICNNNNRADVRREREDELLDGKSRKSNMVHQDQE
ncbi:hypothetical protein FOCC_FOCC012128 [Frankliniella occidentalis]|nr:hypothetical protein FOCC_FOCC012128 [Frankliniella occidentalis]